METLLEDEVECRTESVDMADESFAVEYSVWKIHKKIIISVKTISFISEGQKQKRTKLPKRTLQLFTSNNPEPNLRESLIILGANFISKSIHRHSFPDLR